MILCICFIYLEPKWLYSRYIYIYYVDSIAIASRYIQHFDKATDGGQRLSWLSKILQVLRKKGPEKRICSFQSFCFTVPPNWKVSESWSFAMCNTAPWPISHSPTAWPSPSDGGRYRKAVVQGLDERCSRIQHGVMKTKAKEKDTHTQKYVSSGCEILLAILLSFLFLMCLMCSPAWR